jgi:hypothetical protein
MPAPLRPALHLPVPPVVVLHLSCCCRHLTVYFYFRCHCCCGCLVQPHVQLSPASQSICTATNGQYIKLGSRGGNHLGSHLGTGDVTVADNPGSILLLAFIVPVGIQCYMIGSQAVYSTQHCVSALQLFSVMPHLCNSKEAARVSTFLSCMQWQAITEDLPHRSHNATPAIAT